MAEFNCSYKKALTIYIPPSPSGIVASARKEELHTEDISMIIPSTSQRSYVEVLKSSNTTYGNTETANQKITQKVIEKKSKKKKSMSTNNQTGESFDWGMYSNNESDRESSIDEDTTENKEKPKISFIELLKRISNICFMKNLSTKKKAEQVVCVVLEWVVYIIESKISAFTILKQLFNIENG
ncbi:unnamed protein product, partial [Brenthis ino]